MGQLGENRSGILLAGGSYVASEVDAQKHITGDSEDAFLLSIKIGLS